VPGIGALAMLCLFIKSCFALKSAGSTTIFGIGAPLAVGIGALLLGCMLMTLARWRLPEFFLRKREAAYGVGQDR
jgi:hypothetical protein